MEQTLNALKTALEGELEAKLNIWEYNLNGWQLILWIELPRISKQKIDKLYEICSQFMEQNKIKLIDKPALKIAGHFKKKYIRVDYYFEEIAYPISWKEEVNENSWDRKI